MILVVDDNAPMRRALADTLRFLGYPAIEAGNGLEALSIIEKAYISPAPNGERLRMVMSDLSMPVMDGRELFSAMRSKEISLPFVMFSGFLSRQEHDELTGMGITACLHKPADISQIADLLRQHYDH
jgi:two-component system response regulator FlrC